LKPFFTGLSHITRCIATILFLAVYPGVSARCLADDGLPPTTPLHLWHQWHSGQRNILDSIIDEFNCSQDVITVFAHPLGPSSGTVAKQIQLKSTGYSLPQLAIIERESIPMLAEAGIIRALDEVIEREPSLKKGGMLECAYKAGSYDGKLYGLPVNVNPYVLIYNPELLSRLGISGPPTKWPDFIEIAHLVGSGGGSSEGIRLWTLSTRSMAPIFHLLCYQRGVNLLGAGKNPESASDLSGILRFIQLLRQTDSLLSPHFKFWDPNFIGITSGKVLFQLDNAAMLAQLLKQESVPMQIVPPPSDTLPAQTLLASSQVFVIPTASVDIGPTVTFLEHFFSRVQYSRFAEEFLFVAPFKRDASLEDAVSNTSLYPRLVSASHNAGVLPLERHAATRLAGIARIVDQLDAGLVSHDTALERIVDEARKNYVEPAASPSPSVRAAWAEGTRRLLKNETSGFRMAPIEIVAARNEHEAFQLVLCGEREMDGLRISLLPFTARDGTAHELSVTTYLETDTPISKPVVAHQPGMYPNILLPQSVFRVQPGELARIWIDLFVPSRVPPGELSSELIVDNDGTMVARLSLRLIVLPLQLPRRPSFSAAIGLDYESIAEYYGLNKESETRNKLVDSFYWFMAEHRLSPFQPPVSLGSPEASAYLADERVVACRIPFHPDDPRFTRALTRARGGGWLPKMFSYFIDEPTYHQYDAVIQLGERIHSLTESPKFLVTCFPDEPLVGSVDIWCIHVRLLPEGIPNSFLERERYAHRIRERLESGDTVWWYTAGAVKPFPTLHIEDDPNAFRILPWLQQLCGIDGLLHWESANWRQSLDDPFVPHFGNGEGVLVYPGDRRPLPSVRLELLRDGLEDAEYLTILRESIKETQRKLEAQWLGDAASLRIGELCRRLISDEALRIHAGESLLLTPHFTREPGAIERVRAEVAEEIQQLEHKPLALVLTEPQERQYTDARHARIYGAAEPHCKVEVNGHRIVADRRGKFSFELPLTRGANVICVNLELGKHRKSIFRRIETF